MTSQLHLSFCQLSYELRTLKQILRISFAYDRSSASALNPSVHAMHVLIVS